MIYENDKIKYKLKVDETTIRFKVLRMDERFRKKRGDIAKNFRARNGILVSSYSTPEIRIDQVYLRGETSNYDDYLSELECDSRQQAVETAAKIREALDEWAIKWEGWEETEEVDVKVSCSCDSKTSEEETITTRNATCKLCSREIDIDESLVADKEDFACVCKSCWANIDKYLALLNTADQSKNQEKINIYE